MKIMKIVVALLVIAVMVVDAMAVADNEAPASLPYEINYADIGNWVKISDAGKEVDVFYLYPTCWMPTEADGMVNTINNKSMREQAPGVYAEQASCFEGVANIYAPYYRQLNAMKSLSCSLEEQEKLVAGVPYHDALAAFEYYLTHFNNGRPFILAGHSQGSNVLKFLLSEYMASHPEVYSRMVAAYALGYSYSRQYFQANPHLKFAEGETDTRVIISWNCEFMKDGKFGGFNLVCHKGALSINPVSWSRDNELTEAGDSRNLGALDTRERYSAQVKYDPARQYEVLVVGTTDQPACDKGIGEFALHSCDFRLYYYNICENAKKRVHSYFNHLKSSTPANHR
jgi:hypothetical protein